MSTKPLILDVPDMGDIGTGRVVPFQPRKTKEVALPPNLKPQDQPITYKAVGQCLAEFGINTGDTLICRARFERAELRPWMICVVLLHGSELTAKRVLLSGDRVHLFGAGPEPWYEVHADEVEVKAIVVAFQRSLDGPYAFDPPPPKTPGDAGEGTIGRVS